MATTVLILGESGSGKSASLRNFASDEVGIINVAGKPLPFRNKFKTLDTDNYGVIMKALAGAKAKSIVIDDAQYLMANEFMRNAKVTGFQKFTDIALNFWNLVQFAQRKMPADDIVYFLSHIERDQNGNEKMKTIGRMLDEKITMEGLFTVVLKTRVADGVYQFATQTNGTDTVKSPIGMFPEMYIENDLKMVDSTIREYYGMSKEKESEAK